MEQGGKEPGRKRSASGSNKKITAKLSAYRTGKRRKRRRRPIPRVAVPSFFTLMNLLCGFGSIIQTHEGNVDMACWLIVLAGFFDALDGMMARLTNSTSLFGVELDSLSDVVSFGVAPGFLVYEFGLKEFGLLGLLVAALPALCGAVRLARFNINVELEGNKPEYFSGLPIPVQALAVVTLILNIGDTNWLREFSMSNLNLLIPIVAVLAGLMVSTVPFDALPKPTPQYIRKHPYKAGAMAISMVLMILLQQIGILISIVAYLIFGIFNAFTRVLRLIRQPDEPE